MATDLPEDRLVSELSARLEELARHTEEIMGAVVDVRQWLGELTTRLPAVELGVERVQEWSHELATRVDRNVETLARLSALADASTAIPRPEPLDLEVITREDGQTCLGYRSGAPVAIGQEYLAFENHFRETEEVIRIRQQPYLDLLHGHSPVVDIGCGRGEFLELLRDRGIKSEGVDTDAAMVVRCHAKRLTVHHGDGVAYVESQRSGTLGAVFAAQLVEHLPYSELIRFLRASRAALRDGGLLIAETVNPHAPTALKNFWLDPTHQHPVFPEVLLTLCRATGFESAYVSYPSASGSYEADARLPDYAVVARAGTGAE